MTSTSATDFERATLNRLRDDFEAKGYRFIMDPPADQLPAFLHSYRPDAVAIGRDDADKVIIEVKQHNTRSNRIPVGQINLDAASKTGWRYLPVYAGQDPSEIIEPPGPQKSQIDEAIKEVRQLENSGYLRAGILEGWSLLEALARRIYPDYIQVSLRPLSPVTVVERLAMDGQISDQDGKRLRALSSIRNSVVHGDLTVSVSEDDLQYLLWKNGFSLNAIRGATNIL